MDLVLEKTYDPRTGMGICLIFDSSYLSRLEDIAGSVRSLRFLIIVILNIMANFKGQPDFVVCYICSINLSSG